MESAILVGNHALDELRELATSAGARVIDEVVQRRDVPILPPTLVKAKSKKSASKLFSRAWTLLSSTTSFRPTRPRIWKKLSIPKSSIAQASYWTFLRGALAPKRANSRWSWPS